MLKKLYHSVPKIMGFRIMKKLLFNTTSVSLDLGLLILRVAAGAMIITHGWPKLASYASRADSFRDPIGMDSALSLQLAIFAEVICAVFIILGAFTRLAAIPLMITKAVIAFIVHLKYWQVKTGADAALFGLVYCPVSQRPSQVLHRSQIGQLIR